MKFLKLGLAAVLATVCLAGYSGAWAGDGRRTLIYISPQEYAHETNLRFHFINYWFSQGEYLEPIALESLKPVLGESAMCRGNLAADLVVMLSPGMFYNPYMTTFYGKVVARAFSGSGRLIGTYQAKVERQGFLDVMPENQIKATYRAAMTEVVRQMQLDAALQPLIAQGLPESETRMPCGMVAILPQPR